MKTLLLAAAIFENETNVGNILQFKISKPHILIRCRRVVPAPPPPVHGTLDADATIEARRVVARGSASRRQRTGVDQRQPTRYFTCAFTNGYLVCPFRENCDARRHSHTGILADNVGAAVAGPAEDFRDAEAARRRDDYATALRLYLRAAEQGHIDAQMELADIYFLGLMRVPEDKAASAKWYLRAAELGNAMAQGNIGLAYWYGKGVPKNQVMGLMWLNLAVAQGLKDAVERRDRLAEQATPAQVAEAKKLADEWKPKR